MKYHLINWSCVEIEKLARDGDYKTAFMLVSNALRELDAAHKNNQDWIRKVSTDPLTPEKRSDNDQALLRLKDNLEEAIFELEAFGRRHSISASDILPSGHALAYGAFEIRAVKHSQPV